MQDFVNTPVCTRIRIANDLHRLPLDHVLATLRTHPLCLSLGPII